MADAMDGLETLSDRCFTDFLGLIHVLTGITILPNRKMMVQGRIRKHIRSLGLKTYDDYYQFLKSDSAEQLIFIDLITTNETYFFRTPRVWHYLENSFFPQWCQAPPKATLSAWSAAASSGEEAHSLAILCQEQKLKSPDFKFQILGTDISQEMIARCRLGLYKMKSIDAFKQTRPTLFTKYMKPVENGYFQAPTEVRSSLRFQQHNLFAALPNNPQFDLILLRNVLIYFTPADQEIVLAKAYERLSDRGILIIGESESLSHVKTKFKQVEPLIYSRSDCSLKLKGAA